MMMMYKLSPMHKHYETKDNVHEDPITGPLNKSFETQAVNQFFWML